MGNVENPYRDFCDKLQKILGSIYWPIVGNLYKSYDSEHILKCAELIVGAVARLEDMSKAKYLAAVCRNGATQSSLKEVTNDDALKVEFGREEFKI